MDLNLAVFIGKVEEQPSIAGGDGNKRANFRLLVNRREQRDGQWVNIPMPIPMFAYDPQATVIERYVETGQELTILGEVWVAGDGRWAVRVQSVSLGFKPRKDQPQQQNAGGGDIPF